MGNLTTCEKTGQKIKHVTGTEGVIVGSYYGGFQVKAEGRTMMLPFENIGGWNRVEEESARVERVFYNAAIHGFFHDLCDCCKNFSYGHGSAPIEQGVCDVDDATHCCKVHSCSHFQECEY